MSDSVVVDGTGGMDAVLDGAGDLLRDRLRGASGSYGVGISTSGSKGPPKCGTPGSSFLSLLTFSSSVVRNCTKAHASI